MKYLQDYDFLVNEVFYRCWHILDYIDNHPDMSPLDLEAVKATIMDALVYRGLIDPEKESLDINALCIREDLSHYRYDKCPEVCGIPQWMKEKYRKKCITVSGGTPLSIFLAKPPTTISRNCIYDMNTAASAIFEDATFYNVFYTSPTRGVRIDNERPFVEVNLDGEAYLIDVLTKRIFKSSFFKKKYGFDIVAEGRVSELTDDKKRLYKSQVEERNNFEAIIPLLEMRSRDLGENPVQAETLYEFEKSREYYPESFIKAEQQSNGLDDFFFITGGQSSK